MPLLNIVFDLGGVVFEWQPQNIVRRVFADDERQKLVVELIFGHTDWIDLDRGTLAVGDAIVRGASRTGLSREAIARLFAVVPVSLTPKHETIDLIRSLDNGDHRLYVLSNMHAPSIDYLEKQHDIWGHFDGSVISSRVKMVKPERGIYLHLLTEFGLAVSETVFIDDTLENLEAAASLGMQTIQFENAEQCRRELTSLGCI